MIAIKSLSNNYKKIAIAITIVFNFIYSSELPYILVVSFDGFRYDYTNLVDTPNFNDLAESGIKAESLIPVFPSLTFPNHYSIATGSYSGSHYITSNTFFSKVLNQKYSLYDKNAVRDAKFYRSEPIWVTAERQGIRTASFYWVGSEAKIKGVYPSIYKNYDGSIPFKTRIDSVISWFELPDTKRPNLIMLYFSEPDHTGHETGPESKETFNSVSEMDALLGYLREKLKELEIYQKLNLIVLSDHGMSSVSKDRLIILDEYISDLENYSFDGSGTMLQIDYKNKSDKNKLTEELKLIPNCDIFKKDDIPQRFHFNNLNTGDYLILANEGWFITDSNNMTVKDFILKGMHGYDPNYPNMHGIFFAEGPNFKKGLVMPSFENIHIYSLLCKILNIKPYKDIDGNVEIFLKYIN